MSNLDMFEQMCLGVMNSLVLLSVLHDVKYEKWLYIPWWRHQMETVSS